LGHEEAELRLLVPSNDMHRTAPRMTTMHLALQNAETINRLVEQGELLLKTFHVEREKDQAGWNTEFVLGELTGWRSTLHTLYRDRAEEIVARVVARTHLTFPEGEVPSGAAHAR
jgi:hypothetical protein